MTAGKELSPSAVPSVEWSMLHSVLIQKGGAVAAAPVPAEAVTQEEWSRFKQWLEKGHNAGMAYMHNYPELRQDPRAMHPGTRWIISVAFAYGHEGDNNKKIASYALGDDYHKVIPKQIKQALRSALWPSDSHPEEWLPKIRICVDSAPVLERYWAERSGIGARCDNGLIFIPGAGTRIFLAEILLTADLIFPEEHIPDATPIDACTHCGACRRACPAGALQSDGTVDANRCLSYLTIEHRGAFSSAQQAIIASPRSGNPIFGCDICQNVCPLNRGVTASVNPRFSPREEILSLANADRIETLTAEEFDGITAGSPLRRAGLDALRRNISAAHHDS